MKKSNYQLGAEFIFVLFVMLMLYGLSLSR